MMLSDNKPSQGGFVIFLTVLVGLGLVMMPLPDWMDTARPAWLVMIMIYWCIALPNRVGVVAAWFMGLLLDVGSSTLLGQNALAFTIVAYLAIRLHQRIRLFPIPQQALSVLILVALYQMINLWIKGSIGQSSQSWSYWLPALSSMLFWPLVYLTLRNLRRRRQIR